MATQFPTATASHIKDLKNDGSTACGGWIYCGVFPQARTAIAPRTRSERLLRPRLGIRLAQRLPNHLQPRLGAP